MFERTEQLEKQSSTTYVRDDDMQKTDIFYRFGNN